MTRDFSGLRKVGRDMHIPTILPRRGSSLGFDWVFDEPVRFTDLIVDPQSSFTVLLDLWIPDNPFTLFSGDRTMMCVFQSLSGWAIAGGLEYVDGLVIRPGTYQVNGSAFSASCPNDNKIWHLASESGGTVCIERQIRSSTVDPILWSDLLLEFGGTMP
jgi:hypothetical protein